MGVDDLPDRSGPRDAGVLFWDILDGLSSGRLKPSQFEVSWDWIVWGRNEEPVRDGPVEPPLPWYRKMWRKR